MIYTKTKVVDTTIRGILEKYDVIAHQGGTYSGKTFGIITALVSLMVSSEQHHKIRVVGQSVPHLKDGALSDFKEITDGLGIHYDANETDKLYHIGNSAIKFLSVDKLGKAKGAKFDITFLNECNEISFPIAQQLILRTNDTVILDWNPTHEFWFHTKTYPDKSKRILYKRTTYKDNPSVTDKKIREIEGLKNIDEELYRVYALGLTGRIQGLIFPNWSTVTDFPDECKKVAYGLDFGFTNDPTALVKIGELHGELYGQELIYETGLTNPDISAKLDDLGIDKRAEIIADSAEPKSIAELRRMGWNVKPAKKGRDSVNFGIGVLKRYRINITADSQNWRKEARNYKWKEKDGEMLNLPIDEFNHAWDAARYYAMSKLALPKKKVSVSYL